MHCTSCGTAVDASDRFCRQCGAAQTPPPDDGLVNVRMRSRRVRVGSLAGTPDAQHGDVRVAPDSEEARNADLPFDASVYPGPDGLVPADCAWAFHPHPGQAAGVWGNSQDRMVALGTLSGRTRAEIVDAVGAPNAVGAVGNGNALLQWHRGGIFSAWNIALLFDPYGVCIGVSSEIAV